MNPSIFSTKKFASISRTAAAEGIVMLKNDNHVLPLPCGTRIALFGRSQFHYYKSGTGSGGLVNTKYVIGIQDALESDPRYVLDNNVKSAYLEWLKNHPFDPGQHWADEPWFQEEMPLEPGLVSKAALQNDAAVIVIGRTAGEDQDNQEAAGSYLLTDAEKTMLDTVCNAFSKTIVLLNVGNIIDMQWVNTYKPKAVLYVWQGGQEGGNAVLDVLSGDITPSGKLTDTIAESIADIPSAKNFGGDHRNIYEEDIYVGYRYFETFAKDKVLYPFGFGLSYTTFSLNECTFTSENPLHVSVKVTNTGHVSGKEVIQIYSEAPQGLLGKPLRVLVGFAKTRLLLPGESEIITIFVPTRAFSSYDDGGITGMRSAFVLEAGDYHFYVGTDVRSAILVGTLTIPELTLVEQCHEAMAPTKPFHRMHSSNGNLEYEPVPLQTITPAAKRLENIPAEIPQTVDLGYKLQDVASGNVSLEAFIAQLSDYDLTCLIRGEGMNSPKVTPGVAGSFGGVTDSLQSFGIPIAACSDGPCGIRMDCGTTAFSMPNGTCLACTFDTDLVHELYHMEGLELRKNHIDMLLGPGINIHRNPLNGRNFEYFSEDPFLTGRMAVAQLQGMHECGVTGTIKHMACNNQEFHRFDADAVVSERALREIYLAAFEMAVREGHAYSIMTSYNPINGWWSASNYDMLTSILRNEWGYRYLVMTDWWAYGNDDGQSGVVTNTSAMVRAQNDLFMVVSNSAANSQGDNSMDGLNLNLVARAEFQRSAMNICRTIMKTPAFFRLIGIQDTLDAALENCEDEEAPVLPPDAPRFNVQESLEIEPSVINTAKGKTTYLAISSTLSKPYRLLLTIRASQESPEMSQLPLSIFQGNSLLQTVTLNGAEKSWKSISIQLKESVKGAFLLRFYSAESGMEISKIRLECIS